MTRYKYVLFDLDGTIAASADGIRHSLERMLETLGREKPDLSDYTVYIGPPLYDTLRGLCALPEELVEEGYNLYRHFYEKEGSSMNKPYEGIEAVLKALKNNGLKLAVCSSKLEPTAVEVIRFLGLSEYFDAVCGSNRDGSRKDKRDLIPYAIEMLGGSKAESVMLGDTFYDAKGAEETGVDFIACSYGYGSDEAMREYHPTLWAKAPGELIELILNKKQ